MNKTELEKQIEIWEDKKKNFKRNEIGKSADDLLMIEYYLMNYKARLKRLNESVKEDENSETNSKI